MSDRTLEELVTELVQKRMVRHEVSKMSPLLNTSSVRNALYVVTQKLEDECDDLMQKIQDYEVNDV